jgi:hypothetical protein
VNFEVKYPESESAKPDALHSAGFESISKCRLVGRFEESFCSEANFPRHYRGDRAVRELRGPFFLTYISLHKTANILVRK